MSINSINIINKRLDTIFLYIGYCMVLIGSTLLTTDTLRFLYYPLLGLGLVIITLNILRGGFRKTKSHSFNILIFFLFLTMFFSMILSSFNEEDIFLETIGFIVFVFFSLILLSHSKINTFKILYISGFISAIVVVIFPFILGNYQIPFQGIFYNPNSMGNVAATFYGLFFSVFIHKLYCKKIDYILLFLVFIFFFLTFISMSRGSLFSICLLTIVYMVVYLKEKKMGYKYLFIFVASFSIIIYLIIHYGENYELFVNKLDRREDNLTAGRIYIWEYVLENVSAWGYGRQKIADINIGYHSTYISFLAQFGLIPFVFFIIVLIKMLYNSFLIMLYSLRSIVDNYYHGIAFALGTIFLLLSITEGMLMKFSMIIFFLSYASISSLIFKSNKV